MSRFWSNLVHQLVPYVPGEQPKIDQLVKLNTNENPYSPSPKVLEAIREASNEGLKLYPDPNAEQLKQSIAHYHGVNIEQVFVGNGSDEVLAHVFCALLKQPNPLLFPDITYSFYPVYCQLYSIDYQTLPIDEQMIIHLADYDLGQGPVIFPNPNAPTGRALPLAEIESFVKRHQDRLVVVDEAYVDYGADTAIALIQKGYDNVLAVQTLSKSRSLAGLRVGFAIGAAPLIEALERVKNSFNSYPIDKLAMAGAIASFADETYFQQMRLAVIQSREYLASQLSAMGFWVVPSSANFVFVRHDSREAVELARLLRERKVLVRHFKLPRIDNFLRITVGSDAQNETLLIALSEILA